MSEPVQQFYDGNSDREWERLARHRTELAVTLRALADHLPPPPAQVLDVGGGPGRYAIALTQQGYTVTLSDLAASNLALAQQKAAAAGVELQGCQQANALDLGLFPAAAYDVVLLLGPLYHLLEEKERQQAVKEALARLRPGGVLCAAFISRWAVFRDAAKKNPRWLLDYTDYAEHLRQTGQHEAPKDATKGFTNAYFAHPAEIVPFMEKCGLQTILFLGCEGVVAHIDEQINELGGSDWETWVDFNYRVGQDPTTHGAADHLLYIGRLLHNK